MEGLFSCAGRLPRGEPTAASVPMGPVSDWRPKVIDRFLRMAQVLALLWIGYELHVLAHPDPEVMESDAAVDSAAVLAPRL